MRERLARPLNLVMEGVIALLAVGSVWPFASVLPFFQWILFAFVAALLVLWALRALLEGRLLFKTCPVVVCLTALCILTMLQIVPLPRAWVTALSPKTTELRDALLPSADETGIARAEETTATLSLAPGVTRLELLRLIAALALFAAVRNNLVDPGAFYRLGWLLAANGVMLALIGMGQLTSSPRNEIYWSVPTKGQVFGPFVCRNHAAYYLNLCLGLTAGLLLGTRYFLTSERSSWRGIFRDPRVLWLICGIGIMFAGLVATLSRGGLIGLGIGVVTCLGLLIFQFGKRTPWIGAGLILGLSAALIFWQGSDRVSQRWDKMGGENSTPEARIEVWTRSWPLVSQFPTFGTGLGTFGHVEQMRRQPGDNSYVFNDHAHNDFLEIWIEGGTIQLLLALAIIILVFRKGYQAFRQQGDTGLGRLALGALIAFIAIVLHSFVDFGLHIPAVAVLAAVVGGMLMNLADLPAPSRRSRSSSKRTPPPPQSYGLAALEAVSLVLVACYLVHAGWRDQQAERYLWASSLAPVDTKITYLKAAVDYAPDRPEPEAALAESYVEKYLERKRLHDCANAASTVAAAAGAGFPAALAFCERSGFRPPEIELESANVHLVRACQKNPLWFDAQERLERLSTIGSLRGFKGKRLERLVFLSPSDPAPWFWIGQEALDKGDKAKAFKSFRNSLLAEKKFLPDIAKTVPERISPIEFLQEVLPPNPALIVDAAKALSSQMKELAEEPAYYKEALRLLQAKGNARTGAEWMSTARAQIGLGDDDAARKSFASALEAKPDDPYWRFEFCELLERQADAAELRKQLAIVTFQDRQNYRAVKMFEQLMKDRNP
jgi:O-antigen ligase